MQKSSATLIATFFVSLVTNYTQATDVEIFLENNTETAAPETITNHLCILERVNSLSPEAQAQFLEVLENYITEALENDAQNSCENTDFSLIDKIHAVLMSLPYLKIAWFCINAKLAMIYWNTITPRIKEYPNHEGYLELSKMLVGALIVDDLKDLAKELKRTTWKKCKGVCSHLLKTASTACA